MNRPSPLYSPEILSLAVRLADHPYDEDLPLRAQVNSPTCGSALEIALELDSKGLVWRVGVRAKACAMGQAAATIFAENAVGTSALEVRAASRAVDAWLSGQGPQPRWKGIEKLQPVLGYPARHGAVSMAWKAAAQALSTPSTKG